MALPVNRPNIESDPEGDKKFIADELGKHESKKGVISALSSHIAKVFAENQENFKGVRQEMVKELRRCAGEYDGEMQKALKTFGGTSIYNRFIEAKARAAESWIKDIYTSELPFSVEPTDDPELPGETREKIIVDTKSQVESFKANIAAKNQKIDPQEIADLMNDYQNQQIEAAKKELQEDAKERCESARKVINDKNQEGDWNQAFKDFLFYFVRVKFSAIKGPAIRYAKKYQWQPKEDLSDFEYVAKNVRVTKVYCPSPFNIFPSKGMKNGNDGDIIEVHELSRQSISELLTVPGYNPAEIKSVISQIDKGELKAKWFTIDDESQVEEAERGLRSKEKTGTQGVGVDRNFRAQEFSGSVAGSKLKAWALGSKQEKAFSKLDDFVEYKVNCWKIGTHVIKAVLNPDDLGRNGYHFSSWAKNPASVVGESLVDFGIPIEDAMLATLRALVNNVAIASGPMVEEDKDRVEEAGGIYPWMRIRSTSKQMRQNGPAVHFYQPQMHAQELIEVLKFLSVLLDEMTVPAYAQGASQSGVTAGTATVYTSLLAAAARSIKAVVGNIDDDVIAPYYQMCYDFTMKFTKDSSIRGDAQVVAGGVKGLQAKEEQSQRKVEFVQAMSNPAFMEILGAKNVGAVLAQVAKSNDIDLPDMGRLDGTDEVVMRLQQVIDALSGVDKVQGNGNIERGGGDITSSSGQNPGGSRAGVVNAA